MITGLTIRHFRGIREGELTNIAPLSVLIGRNGSGKSTVLEALAIGGGADAVGALAQVVAQRGGYRGAAYLVPQGKTTSITVERTGNETDLVHIGPASGDTSTASVSLSIERERWHPAARSTNTAPPKQLRDRLTTVPVTFDIHNDVQPSDSRLHVANRDIRLVNPGDNRKSPLWQSLGAALRSGHVDRVVELLKEVLGDDFRDLYPLPEHPDGSATNVHLRYRWGSVPVAVAGDGVRALVRIALDLGAPEGSTVLIEEPELHQHPGAIWQTARAILAALDLGVQVILSTHSLELIDALLQQATDTQLNQTAVFRLKLDGGTLHHHRTDGDAARTLRQDLSEELR